MTNGVRLVAPAFGAFTGGLNVADETFTMLFAETKPIAFMLGRDGVWPVAARNWRPD